MKIIILNCIYFRDIILEIFNQLSRNNINVLISDTDNSISNNTSDIYLIFNIKDQINLPKYYIVYNFEQLQANTYINSNFYESLHNALCIIDYSQLNINYLLSKGFNNVYFIPYGWTIYMKIKNILSFSLRKNNLLFIGALNNRRITLMRDMHKDFKNKNLDMFISNNCWGNEYEQISKISKIGLNIHYYDNNTILEVHRIIPYIINKIWVITEHSDDEYYDNMLDGLVTWITTDIDITNEIDKIRNMESSLIEQILLDRQREIIKRCKYTFNIEILNNLINNL